MNFHVFELLNELIRGCFEQVEFDFLLNFRFSALNFTFFFNYFKAFKLNFQVLINTKLFFDFWNFERSRRVSFKIFLKEETQPT